MASRLALDIANFMLTEIKETLFSWYTAHDSATGNALAMLQTTLTYDNMSTLTDKNLS